MMLTVVAFLAFNCRDEPLMSILFIGLSSSEIQWRVKTAKRSQGNY